MPQHIKPTPIKHCVQCGAKMERKRSNGRLEDLAIFNRRKYCDRACMAAAFVIKEPTQTTLMERARAFRGTCCEFCGTTERLQVHHDDRDRSNNSPSNLKTLCASCHMRLHHRRGDIIEFKPKPPCTVCGKPSYRSGLCSTCRTRQSRYGSPYLKAIRTGASWTVVSAI